MIDQTNEAKWRTGGEGRLDSNGVRWWACDPYPTWYRWENGTLYTPNPPFVVNSVQQQPTWYDDA